MNISKNKVKGKYLSTVNSHLKGKFEEKDIALACGYFELNEFKKESFKTAFGESVLKDGTKISIFKGRLIMIDEEYGGTAFIPKNIFYKSSDWDYSELDFEELNLDYYLYNCIEGVPNNYKEDKEYLKSSKYLDDVETAKEFLELDLSHLSGIQVCKNKPQQFGSFMAKEINNIFFIDSELNQMEDYSNLKTIAEFYKLRLKDCHFKLFTERYGCLYS